MTHSSFLSTLLIAIFSVGIPRLTQADMPPQYESVDHIREQVKAFLSSYYLEYYDQQSPNDEVEITVSNLDSRLRLRLCETGLKQKMASPGTTANRVTVKVSCKGDKPWSIFVPAQINVISDVVVMTSSLPRNAVIAQEDVRIARTNTSTIRHGYFKDLERVIGMQVRRTMRSGSPVRQSYIEPATVVKKGDKVVLEAGNGAFSVLAPGKAMTDGHVGEQIRVQNTASERIVHATVVAPGKVRIAL